MMEIQGRVFTGNIKNVKLFLARPGAASEDCGRSGFGGGGFAMQQFGHSRCVAVGFGIENPLGHPITMTSIANAGKVRAAHGQLGNPPAIAGVAADAAMLDENSTAGFRDTGLRERRTGQVRELAIANRLMRQRFVRAFTPAYPQLRIAPGRAGVNDLDGIGTALSQKFYTLRAGDIACNNG